MKGKLTITISIGFTALILTMVMFTQFKTVEQTDITAIETMREAELRTELSNWKSKYDELDLKLNEVNKKIDEYKKELATNADSSQILKNEVNEAEAFLGYTNLKGEGIVITLKDNEMYNIEYYNLLFLVNELNVAGAEAISINNERIVNTSDIVQINNRIILVNGRRISGPYIVKAIGDKKYLESAITIKGGYIDEMNVEEKTVDYFIQNDIEIPAYQGNMKFEYAKENKENKE